VAIANGKKAPTVAKTVASAPAPAAKSPKPPAKAVAIPTATKPAKPLVTEKAVLSKTPVVKIAKAAEKTADKTAPLTPAAKSVEIKPAPAAKAGAGKAEAKGHAKAAVPAPVRQFAPNAVIIPISTKPAVAKPAAKKAAPKAAPAKGAGESTNTARFPNNAPVPLAPVPTDGKPKKNQAGLNVRDLEHFRELLLAKRRELVGDMTSMEREALRSANGTNLSNLPLHMADMGTDNYEQEFTLGLVEKERGLLRDLNRALAKIQDGTFGICEGTGKPINRPRLEAQPWARFSIEYARLLERGLVRR
jgi:RNA polymerase-binding protein DksA